MTYIQHYASPLGGIMLAANDIGLTGLWFDGQKYYADRLPAARTEQETPVLAETKRWLDRYFSGKRPEISVPFHFIGTAFQKEVWEILCTIPYGQTMTYGEIAQLLAKRRGIDHMSAQAVGGAVGHNEISILVPCHRVVGTGGSLTGYAGGIDRKVQLLTLEGVNMDFLFVPEKGTAR